jgi:hypothetical protein
MRLRSSPLAVVGGVLLLFALAGCGLVPVTTVQPAAPDIVEPPELLINGTAGKPTSWCWGHSCVDGILGFAGGLPVVGPPFEVELPAGASIEGASAIGPGHPAEREQVQIPFTDTTVGAVPDGAVIVTVFVRFAQGGDAGYAWALGRPEN